MAVLSSKLILELVDRVTAPAREVSATVNRLNGRIEANNKRVAEVRGQALGAAAGVAAFAAALWKPISGAVAFESAMADVTKVVDFESVEAFREFQEVLLDLSEIPGMPSANDLAALAAAAGEAGIAAADITRFTEAVAKISTAFDIDAGETGGALAKMMTGLDLTVDEVVLLSDAMNHLSNSQASAAREILAVVHGVGATAKQFGFAPEEVAAFGSAMIAAGAQSDVATTSFRNMGFALTAGETATKRQAGAFRELGLDAVDVAKRMQEDAVGTTVDVMERLAKLPKDVQAAVGRNLFGKEARALGPLLTNLDLVRETLAMVSDESQYAGSAFAEFERRADTFGAKAAAFWNGINNIGTVLGAALFPVLTDLLNHLSPIIAAVGDWAAANPRLVSGIIAATGVLLGLRLAVAALRLAGLMAMGGYLKTVAFGLGTIGARAAVVGSAARESMRLSQSLAAMQGVQVGKLGQIGAALRGISFAVAGMSVAALGPIAVGVGAVASAGYLLWKHWDRIKAVASGVARAIGEALQPAMEALQPVLEPIQPVLDQIARGFDRFREAVSAAVGWVKDLFGSLGEREVLTPDQEAAAERRAYEIARKIINALASLPGKLLGAGRDAIQGLWDGMKERFVSLLEWVRGIPARIREAMPSIDLAGRVGRFFGGGAEEAPEQRKAAGGWVSRGGVTVGEHGEERLYASQAGFIAHHRAVRQMAAMTRAALPQVRELIPVPVAIPQPKAIPLPAVAAHGAGGPVNVSFGDIVIQGGSNASADELRRAFGREATAALRSHFSDAF